MKSFNHDAQYRTAFGNVDTIAKDNRTVYVSDNSPRIGGRLRFQQNPLRFSRVTGHFNQFLQYRRWVDPYNGGTGLVRDAGFSLLGSYGPAYHFLSDGEKRNLRADALIRALNKAGSFQTNLLDMYRTRQETVNMITRRVGQLANAMLCLKRLNWRGACGALGISPRRPRSRLNDIPAVWLEYIYGWKPLIQDCYTAINHPFPEPKVRVHGTARRVINDHGLEGVTGPNQFQLQWTTQATAKAHVTFAVSVDGAAVAAASQLGVTNPAALAWEALPFSFVVDWFLPVGNYLEGLTALKGLKLTGGTSTITEDVITNGNFFHSFSNEDVVEWSTGGSWDQVHHFKDRVLETPDYPFPRVKSPVSLDHFATGMSLLTQAFKR